MNILPNGSVLPFGLLSNDDSTAMQGFNKSYRDTALRAGVVVEIYPADHENNRSKLATEYDVMTVEQNEDRGVTTILYRNCLSSEGLGSVADFFEKTLRKREKLTRKGQAENFKGQNGAIVLLLRLDGVTEKGVIIGGLTHPDRKTTLLDDQPHLEGEYNGVNIKVQKDGSCSLTFKGATDNDGKPLDEEQGITSVAIETDGSVQVTLKKTSIRIDKNLGDITISTEGKVDVSCNEAILAAKENVSVTAEKDVSVTAMGSILATVEKDMTATVKGNLNADVTKNIVAKCKEATIEASGTAIVEGKEVKLGKSAAEAAILGDTFKSWIDTLTVSTALGPSGPPIVPMPPSSLSKKVKSE